MEGERLDDAAMELLRLLPELALSIHEAAPHSCDDLRQTGLTRRQARAVMHLAHRGSVTMGDLAHGLGISRPAASELIGRLTEKGVVRREQDPADRRSVRVSLAGRAEGYADRFLDERRGQVVAALAAFPEVDPAVLVAFLRMLTLQLQRPPA